MLSNARKAGNTKMWNEKKRERTTKKGEKREEKKRERKNIGHTPMLQK